MFKRTTAINKILAMKARKRVIQGGTSAGKTYAVIPILIDRALKTPRLKITVVAETIPAVRDGAVDIFKQVMFDTGRWIDAQWIANPMEYKFGNGSRIQFKAFDTEGKAKAAGKREILFLNEANHIPFIIADALMIRSKETYIDFNPNNEFWAHTEVLPEPNSEFLLLTYLDNEALPAETLEDMLIKKEKAKTSKYWENWWKVYGEGQIGMLQGVVFDNYDIIQELPKDAKFLGYGLDFGFTNDPTALGQIWELNGVKIWHEVIYSTGLLNNDIYNRVKDSMSANAVGYADSADPKSIAELQRMGMRGLQPATKGPDSILYGIQKIQSERFQVTAQSTNLIKELRGYTWAQDKEGNALNSPIDFNNHMIDAIRYWYLSQRKNRAKYVFA
jgi:phage terminase large subunit